MRQMRRPLTSSPPAPVRLEKHRHLAARAGPSRGRTGLPPNRPAMPPMRHSETTVPRAAARAHLNRFPAYLAAACRGRPAVSLEPPSPRPTGRGMRLAEPGRPTSPSEDRRHRRSLCLTDCGPGPVAGPGWRPLGRDDGSLDPEPAVLHRRPAVRPPRPAGDSLADRPHPPGHPASSAARPPGLARGAARRLDGTNVVAPPCRRPIPGPYLPAAADWPWLPRRYGSTPVLSDPGLAEVTEPPSPRPDPTAEIDRQWHLASRPDQNRLVQLLHCDPVGPIGFDPVCGPTARRG
jgi:hypothetical protein